MQSLKIKSLILAATMFCCLAITAAAETSSRARAREQPSTTGGDNAFVGTNAGLNNLSGFNNSFFGTDAGRSNTASDNSFFGRSAGFANTTGTRNVFFGEDAGRFNQSGSANSFVGTSAGSNNTIGVDNTAVGDSANFGSNGLSFATALGSGATVSTSSTVVLGRTSDTVVAPNLLQVNNLGAAGNTLLCRNASLQISTCTPGNFTEKGDNRNAAFDALQIQNAQMRKQLEQQ